MTAAIHSHDKLHKTLCHRLYLGTCGLKKLHKKCTAESILVLLPCTGDALRKTGKYRT